MLNDAIQIVLQFRFFLILAIVVAFVLEIVLTVSTHSFGWQKRNLWLYAFFFGLTRAQCVFLSVSWLWLICMVSNAMFLVNVQICHLIMMILLSVTKFVAWKRKKIFIRDLFNSILLFAAMMAENLLYSYLLETRFQLPIVVILLMLIVFIILYAVYFTMRDLLDLVQFRAIRKDAAETKKKKKRVKKGVKKRTGRMFKKAAKEEEEEEQDTETEPEQESVSEAEQEPVTETKQETETEIKQKTETEIKQETETEIKQETETETEQEAATEAEQEPVSETKQEIVTEPEKDTVIDSETETEVTERENETNA